MKEHEMTLLLIKGMLADLPEDQKAVFKENYAILKKMVKDNPIAGAAAIALIGAELQAEV